MNFHKNKFLIVIAGPTASGKTDLSIELAQYFNTEIINADSRQIYKELSVGTAKPSELLLEMVRHNFINHISIQQDYNVGIYEKEVIEFLENLSQQLPFRCAVRNHWSKNHYLPPPVEVPFPKNPHGMAISEILGLFDVAESFLQ